MSNDYEKRAEEAEQAARRAETDAERDVHLKVARLWRDLAIRKRNKGKTTVTQS